MAINTKIVKIHLRSLNSIALSRPFIQRHIWHNYCIHGAQAVGTVIIHISTNILVLYKPG